jgi:RNA-binding protein
MLRSSARNPMKSRSPGRAVEAPTAPAQPPALTKRRMQELRAEAHHLQPIVQIGHAGVHDAACAAVARALRDHELIKVRLHEPEDKRAMARELAEATGSTLCGLVGHTVILYKPRPKQKRAAKDQRSLQTIASTSLRRRASSS